jgi:hypothetical protein
MLKNNFTLQFIVPDSNCLYYKSWWQLVNDSFNTDKLQHFRPDSDSFNLVTVIRFFKLAPTRRREKFVHECVTNKANKRNPEEFYSLYTLIGTGPIFSKKLEIKKNTHGDSTLYLDGYLASKFFKDNRLNECYILFDK